MKSFSSDDYSHMLEALEPIAKRAGAAIMNVYEDMIASGQVGERAKGDGSPVTKADEAAEAIILAGLEAQNWGIAIVSEENATSHTMKAPARFFLVDPLDGTKEFLKADGQGSFTVNIALVEHGIPVLGVVYAPALDRYFAGASDVGSFENGASVMVRPMPKEGVVAVASLSHRDKQTDDWLASRSITQTRSIGSSLKFCLLASGEADVYPRFGPTMEWDTAAGHAVLNAAGGTVIHPDGEPFLYGKNEFRNTPFVACGGYRETS